MEQRPAGRSRPDDSTGASRPNATPSRLALGVGGLAAASALVTAIVAPPSPVALTAPLQPNAGQVGGAPASGRPSSGATAGRRSVRYVQLAPGESAPPGAVVIDAKAPKPITIVTQVAPPPQQTVVVRTTQSGRVVP